MPFFNHSTIVTDEGGKLMALWDREDIPYDAMGDFSTFDFEGAEEPSSAQENHAGEIKPAGIPQMLCAQ